MLLENQELKELGTKIDNLNQKISDMEKEEAIKVYNKTKREREDLLRDYDRIVSKIQSECEDNIWYFLSSSTDEHEGRTYFTCRCLECDCITEDRSRMFDYVIKTKESFSTVQNKYKEFKDITKDVESLYKLLKSYFPK